MHDHKPENRRLSSVGVAAAELGVSPYIVRELARRKKVGYSRLDDGWFFVDVDEVRDALGGGRTPGEGSPTR